MKVEPPPCDGWNHRWNCEKPITCKGCGVRFTDVEALKREMEMRRSKA